MQDGIPTGEVRIDFERADVDYEVTYCRSGMEESAEKLRENTEKYYPVYAVSGKEKFMGDAEEYIGKETQEYASFKELGEREQDEYKNRYRELLGTERLAFLSPTRWLEPEVCQSDIDNDGEMELYAVDVGYLGMGCLDITATISISIRLENCMVMGGMKGIGDCGMSW